EILRKNPRIHICFYLTPFGLIPIELSDVYPISQTEIALPIDEEAISNSKIEVEKYLFKFRYNTVMLIVPKNEDLKQFERICRKICKRKRIKFRLIRVKDNLTEKERKRILKYI
ncbi:MAG: hypothetical protein QW647_06320, partial [Candidatus Bathyarchaeia archaeon]